MSSLMMGATTCPYFVGMGFYTKDTSFDPAQEWPGTKWQKLEGVFLLAASSGHSVGETGGEENHKLTEAEMPTHNHMVAHGVKDSNGSFTANKYTAYQEESQISEGKYWPSYVNDSGGNSPHNNMPPYAVRVYWERTE